MMPFRSSRRGFAVAAVLYALGLIGVVAGVMFSGYSQTLRNNILITNTLAAKNDLNAANTTMIATAVSPDGSTVCPPGGATAASGACAGTNTPTTAMLDIGNSGITAGNLPTVGGSVASLSSAISGTTEGGVFANGSGVKQLDPWGHYYIVCRWVGSSGNVVQIISAGPSGVLQTSCGAPAAVGDNLMTKTDATIALQHASVWQVNNSGPSGTIQYGTSGVSTDSSGNTIIPGTLKTTSLSGYLYGNGSSVVTAASTIPTTALSGVLQAAQMPALTGDVTNTAGALNTAVAKIQGTSVSGTTGTGSVAFSASPTFSGTLSGAAARFTGSMTLSGLSSVGVVTTNGSGVLATNAQLPAAQMPALTGDVTNTAGNLATTVGSIKGVSVGTPTGTGNVMFSASPTTTGLLTGAAANFSGNVQAASFSGGMTIGGGGVTLSGVVPIGNGGTGQTNATAALNSLFGADGGGAQALNVARLPLSGVVSGGPYNSVTVDTYGRVTSATLAAVGGTATYPIDTTGTGSMALGTGALSGQTVSAAYGNTAFGYQTLAGTLTSAAINNTAFGFQALKANMTGNANSAFGYQALYSNTTASNNTASGFDALYKNTTGASNTANGYEALYSNTTGASNTASGTLALFLNTTGASNTASGYQALYSNTTGGANTASGTLALFSNTTGASNTASGYQALYLNTTGASNTASGTQALYSNTTGASNTASGYLALYSNTTGASNTASGTLALFLNTTGASNTASGYQALYSNTTGGANTASGTLALFSNTTGASNTASGYQALYLNTTGASNTASGTQALYSNTTGASNTASGSAALYSNTTGASNTASGYLALYSNTTGGSNTASGTLALFLNTTGINNTANGYTALDNNMTGSYNTASGSAALFSNTTGSNNTALGDNVASTTQSTGSGNILIGTSSAVDVPSDPTSNFLNIGNVLFATGMTGTVASPAGKVGIGTTAPATSLDLSANTDGLKLQTASAAANSSCSSTLKGSIRYNSNINQIEFCTGSTWQFLAASTGTGCTAPTGGFSFTNVSNATVSTIHNNGAITPTGCSTSLAVTVSGASGSPQVSINGGAWTTSGVLTPDGTSTLNVRMTSSSMTGTTETATVTIGTASQNWTVTTVSGCTTTIGTVCADGTIYVGLSPDSGTPMYIAPCEYGMTLSGSSCVGTGSTYTWSTGTTIAHTSIEIGSTPSAANTGKSNTAYLIGLTDADKPYTAAILCSSLSGYYGHSDWYLPGLGELTVLYVNRAAIGTTGSAGSVSGITGALDSTTGTSFHWSSSESTSYYSLVERFSDGSQSTSGKATYFEVRCVRR